MPRTERILLAGAPGAGKSWAVISIAKFVLKSEAQVWVIDTEDKIAAMLESEPKIYPLLAKSYGDHDPKTGFTEFDSGQGNMHIYSVIDWEEMGAALAEIQKKATPQLDWISVDRADICWPGVQRWFVREKYGRSLAGQLMKSSQRLKKDSKYVPIMDEGSWQVVNEEYETFINTIWFRTRCNVIMTAGVRSVSGDDKQAIKDTFGLHGVMPRGQKELPHQSFSLLLLGSDGENWEITTIKDLPGRKYLNHNQLIDFAVQYGVGVAGWKMVV